MKIEIGKSYVKMRSRQRGAALAVSLIVLLVLTMVVVSGSQEVVLQEKMSSAVRDSHLSLQAAELALRDAYEKIAVLTGTGDFSDTGLGGYYSKDNGPTTLFDSAIWVDAKTHTGSMKITDDQSVPYRYFIEETGIIEVAEENLNGINVMGYGQTTGGGDVTAFKVVARSTGMSGNAERYISTFMGKRL